MKDLEKAEKDKIRGNNRVLWSIPAAFSEKDFDENVKDLHVKVPLYGKVSLGENAYENYEKFLEEKKSEHGGEQFGQLAEGARKGVNAWQDQLNIPANSPMAKLTQHKSISQLKNSYAPGLTSAFALNEYLTAKKLLGVGFYRTDINEVGFLACNMASGYLLFKDIKHSKLDKVKSCIIAQRKAIISLLERLDEAAKNKKESEKIKKELRSFITNHCSIFAYNPLKKEVIWPIIKYIMIQRVIENIKTEKPRHGVQTDPDHYRAFVKNEQGEFEQSAVQPVSLVTLSKVFLAPIALFSETSKEAVFKAGKQLKFMDSFFGRVHLPAQFYRLLSSVVGETLVLVMAIKIMDRYLNSRVADALISKPQAFLTLLQEGNDILGIEYPNNAEAEKISLYEEKLEKEIERALSAGKLGFFSWMQAKRDTFGKISKMGFLCFVLPSLIIKGGPILLKIIKSIGGCYA